ncbi:hypothetical protein [Pseudonocardia alni]|uniref:hypothetical protein n=1 Tax=Pseudonocardia alni TaxID=33907 RepID=UPI0012FE21A0|nr:hypothetical protein [Pseudonocardia alni]
MLALLLVMLLTHASTAGPTARSLTRAATASDDGFEVAATSLVIDGLRIEGNGTAPGPSGGEPTLNLSADKAVGEELTIAAGVADRTLTISCPATCRLTGQPVRLHVVELTATPVVAGLPLVPITLGASTPAPDLLALVRLPQLTLRDVRGRFALITADEVETVSTRIDLLAGERRGAN